MMNKPEKKNMVPFVPQLPVYWLKGQKWISLKDAHSVSSTQPVNEKNVLSKLGVFVTIVIVHSIRVSIWWWNIFVISLNYICTQVWWLVIWAGINEDLNSANITQIIKEALSFWDWIIIMLLPLCAKAAPLKFTGIKHKQSTSWSLHKYCL